MKLNKLTTSIFAILMVALMFSVSSCTKNPTEPTGTGTYEEVFNFVSAGNNIEDISIQGASLERPMALENEVNAKLVEEGRLFGGREPQFTFRFIFKQLQLTEEQLPLVKEVMIAHRDCQKAARIAFHTAIAEIIAEANIQRQAIIQQVKDGTITREEARELFIALNKATKAKIEETGAIEELQAALKDCTETMIAAMHEILDDTQDAIFDKWVEMMKNRKTGGNGPGIGVRP